MWCLTDSGVVAMLVVTTIVVGDTREAPKRRPDCAGAATTDTIVMVLGLACSTDAIAFRNLDGSNDSVVRPGPVMSTTACSAIVMKALGVQKRAQRAAMGMLTELHRGRVLVRG